MGRMELTGWDEKDWMRQKGVSGRHAGRERRTGPVVSRAGQAAWTGRGGGVFLYPTKGGGGGTPRARWEPRRQRQECDELLPGRWHAGDHASSCGLGNGCPLPVNDSMTKSQKNEKSKDKKSKDNKSKDKKSNG